MQLQELTQFILVIMEWNSAIKSSIKKNIISDITVVDSGEGYQNKKRTAKTSGISTALLIELI